MRRKRELLELRAKLGLQNIRAYFSLAWEAARRGDWKTADYCVRKIFWLSRELGVRIPRDIRYWICRRCKRLMYLPRVRLRDNRESHITITCPRCGAVRRIPLRRARDERGALNCSSSEVRGVKLEC